MDLVLHASATALDVLFTPLRMGLLLTGVLLGLVIGIIPGLGGIVGLSLLLPFTYNMDPYSAMAILMGMAAAVSHGDVIPAILFGVPGTVGCAATVVDGYPMAKRGEAGRALGAAFNASLLGGLFGAVVLAVSIPIIRPLILLFGAPEMMSICVFGMTLVASLSGNAPLKGLTAASIGLLLSMIGEDSQTETLRFTFGTHYLWDGMPIVPVALGVFAIPELCDIMINRRSIAGERRVDAMSGQWQGWKDTFSHWFLVTRSSVLGTVCAMVPGLGAAVIDWIAYGHALKTEKGAAQSFGKGDVRGVIAAESSTNAREGGSLIPTIAFGVPAHASMAILLGAFIIQGIVPGPDMLTKHLDVTYTIVWSLTLANVFGTLICFGLANQFARVATVRYAVLLPVVMALVYVGAFEGQHSWGDLVALVLLGTLSWVMKACDWPRPPLVLGFILGSMIERYTFISVERYGSAWLSNKFVLFMFAISILGILQRIFAGMRRGRRMSFALRQAPRLSAGAALALATLALFIVALFVEARWPFGARLVPQMISILGATFALMLLIAEAFRIGDRAGNASLPGGAVESSLGSPELQSFEIPYLGLSQRQVYGRALGYFLWIYVALLVAYVIGLLPMLALFPFVFMLVHGRESWKTAGAVSLGLFAFLWLVFDRIVHEPWPTTVLGNAFPALRSFLPWF